jgi:hypothetical protein
MYNTNCIECDNQFSYKINRARKFCSKKCLATHYNSRKSYDYARDANLKHWFGISIDDYNQILKDQDSKCAICGEAETWFIKRWNKLACLAVDHDHNTGEVRALLCRRCNQALGKFNDDPELFDKAAAYLRDHK